jgi:hypothetical protein
LIVQGVRFLDRGAGGIHNNKTRDAYDTEVFAGDQSARRRALRRTNAYILLTERAGALPSAETSANHIGFTVRDYTHYLTECASSSRATQGLTDAGWAVAERLRTCS